MNPVSVLSKAPTYFCSLSANACAKIQTVASRIFHEVLFFYKTYQFCKQNQIGFTSSYFTIRSKLQDQSFQDKYQTLLKTSRFASVFTSGFEGLGQVYCDKSSILIALDLAKTEPDIETFRREFLTIYENSILNIGLDFTDDEFNALLIDLKNSSPLSAVKK